MQVSVAMRQALARHRRFNLESNGRIPLPKQLLSISRRLRKMRFLLTLMAMAVLAVSIGCDKKADDKAGDKAGETSGAAAKVDAPDAGDNETASSDTAGTQKVSLKLPGMT
jgi:hypothetical protein